MYKAALLCGIPSSTLHDRSKGRKNRCGPQTYISKEDEGKLVDRIIQMSKLGFGYSRKDIMELANDIQVDLRNKPEPEGHSPLKM